MFGIGQQNRNDSGLIMSVFSVGLGVASTGLLTGYMTKRNGRSRHQRRDR